MNRFVLSLVPVLLLAHAAQAEAQSLSPEPPPKAEADVSDNRELFDEAQAAYDRGEYQAALDRFVTLYERTGHPALLFNMAQAHRLAGPGHCLDAHRLYLKYLVVDSQPPNGQEVRERIKQLEPCAQAAEAAAENQNRSLIAAERAAPAKQTAEAETEPTLAPIVAVVGSAVLVSGLGLFTAAKIRFAQAKDECPCEPGSLSTWETLEQVSVGMMAVGGAGLAASGVYWWASASPTSEVVSFGVSGRF